MSRIRWFSKVGTEAPATLRERPRVRHGKDEAWDTDIEPPVDMIDRGEDVVVRVFLPEVHPGDVDLRAGSGMLRVRAVRHEDERAPSGRFLRRESTGGTFQREIPVPEGYGAGQASAVFQDGVLEVTLGHQQGGDGERRLDVGYGEIEEIEGIPDPRAAAVRSEPGGRPKDLRDRTDIRWPGGNLDAEGPYPEHPEWLEDYMSGGEEQEYGYSATGQAGPGEEHGGFPEEPGDRLVETADVGARLRSESEVSPEDDDERPGPRTERRQE